MPEFLDFTGRAFLTATPAAVAELESITAMDKAQAVPYLRIFEIDRQGKRTSQQPLSVKFMEPPQFGESVDRYAERPVVSLESFTVKSKLSLPGLQLFSTVDISIVVHKPDAIFHAERDGGSDWWDLLIPRRLFEAEYGWAASCANGIMNGDGIPGDTTHPTVPGRRQISFTVNSYSFEILHNGEFKFIIHALEDGEHSMRKAHVGALGIIDTADEKLERSKNGTVIDFQPESLDSPRGKRIVKYLQDRVDELRQKAKGAKGGLMVSLQDILDVIFAPIIDYVLSETGYDVDLRLGRFNGKVGFPAREHGQADLSNHSIGEFQVAFETVAKIFGEFMKTGEQMTVYNFMTRFLSLVQEPGNWRNGSGSGYPNWRKPDIKTKIVYARDHESGKRTATLYVVDLNNEVVKFDASERLGFGATKERIKAVLDSRNVPMVSFGHGLSYLQEGTTFNVDMDSMVKTVMIQKSMGQTRQDVTGKTNAATQIGRVDPAQLIYASAIRGELQMLGNFVFDSFGLLWIDFGIPQWSGTFFGMEKEDRVTRADFSTRIAVHSAGDDPLGTQGHTTPQEQQQVRS